MPASSSLDLFILGLLQTGVNTPYLFRERAHLSLGATLPALKRLEAGGYVRRAERGLRNKQEFEITAAGRRAITTGVASLLHEYELRPPSDIESILRLTALSAGRVGVGRILNNAATMRKARSAQLEPPKPVLDGDLAGIYSSLLASWRRTSLEAEADALTELASRLSRAVKRPGKPTRHRKDRT